MPAGFSVFTFGENPEVFLYLEEGELEAVVQKDKSKEQIVFTVQPGETVGVPCLLEKEIFPYTLRAKTESSFLEINEENLSSSLRTTPIWLLAAIRKTVLQIKNDKKVITTSLCKNKTHALVAFLQMRAETYEMAGKQPIFPSFQTLLEECAWISRVSVKELYLELLSLERRQMVMIQNDSLGIPNTKLLEVYADFLKAVESGMDFPPFHLNLTEKRCLFRLAQETENPIREAPEWLKLLQLNDKFATVAEIILFEKLGIFQKTEFDLLAIQFDTIQKFILALKFENEIKGNAL